jgi:hypothetical protein
LFLPSSPFSFFRLSFSPHLRVDITFFALSVVSINTCVNYKKKSTAGDDGVEERDETRRVICNLMGKEGKPLKVVHSSSFVCLLLSSFSPDNALFVYSREPALPVSIRVLLVVFLFRFIFADFASRVLLLHHYYDYCYWVFFSSFFSMAFCRMVSFTRVDDKRLFLFFFFWHFSLFSCRFSL